MLTQQNRHELETLGVTVVHGVIPEAECDRHQAGFRRWLGTFPLNQWPQSRNSLIQRYKSGHLQPAWEARLAAKPVFAQLWGTQKLLTSMDAVAIGRPPEEGQEAFWSPNDSWLHVDQSAEREGLHAYQGAVYLEHCAEGDWTFEVIEGSHKYFEEFADMTQQWRCKNVKPHHVQWFEGKGCTRRRVPCPKGGLILWDSRLVHANARPVQGREHARWRFVVFVCMAPAAWASADDLGKKIEAYERLQLTTHWPSEEVRTFSDRVNKDAVADPNPGTRLPEVAQTDEVRRLVGALAYDEDEEDDGEATVGGEAGFRPRWNREKWRAHIEEFKQSNDSRRGKNRRRAHKV